MKFLRFWFPVISYSAMIFYVSGLPNLDVGIEIPHFDKVLHIGEYAVLGLLFARALQGTQKTLSFFGVLSLTFLFIVVFGIADEWRQMFVPGRDASSMDVLSDCIGGFIGVFLYSKLIKRTIVWRR